MAQFYLNLRRTLLITLVAGLGGVSSGQTHRYEKSDAEITELIITESVTSYVGDCPCPYNTDWKGKRCDARSAYGRPEGILLSCYPRDVTPKMIAEYRRAHRER